MSMAEATPDKWPFRCSTCGHRDIACTAERVRLHRTVVKGVKEWLLLTCPTCGNSLVADGNMSDPRYADLARQAVSTVEMDPPRDVRS